MTKRWGLGNLLVWLSIHSSVSKLLTKIGDSFIAKKSDQGVALDPQNSRNQNPEKEATGRSENRDSRGGSPARACCGQMRGRSPGDCATHHHAARGIFAPC